MTMSVIAVVGLLTVVFAWTDSPRAAEPDQQSNDPGQATEEATASPENPWVPWTFWLGEWRGDEKGSFGEGRGERKYEMVLDDQFLLARNRSSFPPQPGLEKGDEHEDIAMFSYDKARRTYVMRQFVSEGFVNRLVLDPSSRVPQRMVFVGEASENSPPGLQTRLTLEMVGDHEFVEVFEIGPPGGVLNVVLRNRWHRVEN